MSLFTVGMFELRAPLRRVTVGMFPFSALVDNLHWREGSGYVRDVGVRVRKILGRSASSHRSARPRGSVTPTLTLILIRAQGTRDERGLGVGGGSGRHSQ